MPVTANGLNLIDDGSVDWATEVNDNFDAFDDLITRIAALEVDHLGELPSLWIMSPGSNWTDFMVVYNSAQAGETIMLANEVISQTSAWAIQKSIKIIGHPGGASGILVLSSLTQHSAAIQILVGWHREDVTAPIPLSHIEVELSGFSIQHVRPTVTDDVFVVGRGVDYLDITRMVFTDLTGSLLVVDTANVLAPVDGLRTGDGAQDINLHNNTVNEWYEGICYIKRGSCDKINIRDNACTITTPNPSGGSLRPFAVWVSSQTAEGYVTRVAVHNNTFDASGCLDASMTTAYGARLSMTAITGETRFDNIKFFNNTFTGFYHAFYLTAVNSVSVGVGSFVEFNRNNCVDSISFPINVIPASVRAAAVDRLILGQNHIAGLVGSAIPQIDITACPTYVINNLPEFFFGQARAPTAVVTGVKG